MKDPPKNASPGTLLEWDSAFWGFAIGRIDGNTLTPDSWVDVDRWARLHGVDCLYFLARPDDPQTVDLVQEAGFRLVDVRVELARPSGAPPTAEESPKVRAHRPDDLVTLRAIARTSHESTRFYADPHFRAERCADLYDTWIARSCDGWADAVLVTELEGRVSGYVTCHLDPSAAGGSIGLIAVSPETRGKGLGHDLVRGALEWCHEQGATKVSVVTQGGNVAAQRLFQNCGFRTASTGLWFHRWYDR